MRKILLLLLLIPAGVFAQFTSTARHIANSSSLPATCSPLNGDIWFVESGVSLGPYYCSATNTWTAMGGSGGSGTVTSVSFTGGIISVANPTTTPAMTVTAVSGAVVYGSDSTHWAFSTAPSANLPMFWGGAGAAPFAGTRSGTTTAVVTTTGSQTSGDSVIIDASGNHVASGAPPLTVASLAGVYFSLTSNGQAITGVNTTIASSATEAAVEFTPGGIPSSINVGGVGVYTTGEWFHFDGVNIQFHTTVAGSGRNAPSVPVAGLATLNGSNFELTSTAMGAGVLTFLTTPSSANLASAVTNETGSGVMVFNTSPTLVTPALGAATATSLLASGIVDGKAPVTVTTGTSATLGGTFKSGYTINENATAATAVAYTLPTAADGLQYCVGNGYNGSAANTGVITLNTSASGQFFIFTDGTLSTSGGNVTSGGAGGDFACAVGVDSTHWLFKKSQGTWTKN